MRECRWAVGPRAASLAAAANPGESMHLTIHGLRLEAPADFVGEETMVSWRTPSRPEQVLGLPMQLEVRPNLVAHRRTVEVTDVAVLAGGIGEQLARSV